MKFVDAGAGADTITEVDRGVLQMQTAVTRLETQVEDIQQQIAQCVQRACCPRR